MILYYALGGGLGHLTRGRRVLETLGIEATLVTASAYASDPRVTGGYRVILVPAHLEHDVDAHREWLRGLAPERLIADTFPCGIQGELSGLDVPMDLVARRLRWEEYRRTVPHPLPRFETVWRLEELEPEHEKALWSAAATPPLSNSGAIGKERANRKAETLRIVSPQRSMAHESESGGVASALQRFWLIVHSGPEDEVRELVAYAEELRRVEQTDIDVLVATRCPIDLPDGFVLIDAYPVTHLFEGATRIISAAGFNIMLETEPYRDKHHAIPFARKFDDQFARAAERKRFGPRTVTM